MPGIFERLDNNKGKDLRVLADFVAIFCRERHEGEDKIEFPARDERLRDSLGDRDLVLCSDCRKLLNHSIAGLLLCPYNPKPQCKKCETHCHAPWYRERILEVVRSSSLYLAKRGRLDLLVNRLF